MRREVKKKIDRTKTADDGHQIDRAELLTTAIQLRAEKRFDQAKEILQDLLASSPSDGTLNYHMAWLHDNQGAEEEAVPFYVRALAGQLSDEDRQGALLGLGSTYRCLGRHELSVQILNTAVDTYKRNPVFKTFLALSLNEVGRTDEAFSIVLKQLADTTGDQDISLYKRALLECAEELNAKTKNR